ncbi:MAG: hypothetical protein A2918_00965 [Candidatus Yanofskybacteria bacterium RIFCSPLOWO2_01_FULL_42_49]|uniref:Polyprenol-phosphate-mannose--protein mannosyltransferase n=1 Tax=Candidatus Yanofskybacteria bacterium RIFCSPLOWO2_01_FULL_42_49 TaxID=1802694 RepID=A0A1F8GBB1_9BACT|nr:MAG: hypothetical protein A2918_00965 [Candidatus Yanofskybacteria bacterium RIFCSPLOWO2_01_FULL_42_49]
MSTKWQLGVILLISIAVHFAFFGNPAETVFDEVHFGKFVSGYYTGEYYFDIHPPLGKLMIAGFAKLFDFEPQYSFINIGDKFPDNKYLVLRFLPALTGTLLPLVIYLLVLELGMSRMAAFAGALFVVFDNALLTQSRLMLLDPFLLLFGFTSLLFYFKYTKNRILNTKYLILTAIFAGLAISIKWTGLGFIALPILVEAAKAVKIPRTDIKPAIAGFMSVLKLASFFLISLAIYFSIFVLHFALLPNPGSGDAFMKPNFREQNVVKNIVNLNIEMYKSNQRITTSHPYSSQFYTWPLMARPIYYWVNGNARIYFFGNPIIWWSSTIAVAISLWLTAYGLWIKIKKYSKPSSIVHSPLAFFLGGYFLNLLPFIGVKRVMFLYHYLTALIFAILMLCYLADHNKNSRKIFTGIIIAAIAAFLFFAPLSYGLPLSEKAYSARVWFANWR